jgi:hypothetical protein
MNDLSDDLSSPKGNGLDKQEPFSSVLYFFIIILFLFTSCQHKKVSNKSLDDSKESISQTDSKISLIQAKYFHVPVPVGYKFVEKESMIDIGDKQKENVTFCYEGDLSVDQVKNFYKQTLERQGWDISDFSNALEGLLICNKINKVCAISIRCQLRNENAKVYLIFKDKIELDNLDKNEEIDINSKEVPKFL